MGWEADNASRHVAVNERGTPAQARVEKAEEENARYWQALVDIAGHARAALSGATNEGRRDG